MNITGTFPDWKTGLSCMRVFRSVSLTIDRCLERRNTFFLARRRMQHHGELTWEILWEETVVATVHLMLQGFDPFTGSAMPTVQATLDMCAGGKGKSECIFKCRVTTATKRLCVCQIMTALSEILPKYESRTHSNIMPHEDMTAAKTVSSSEFNQSNLSSLSTGTA